MKKIIISLLSITFLTVSVYAQEENKLENEKAKEILNKLSKKSDSYSDITAEFSYNFFNSSEGIDEDMKGTIWIKKNMYKLDIVNVSVINNGKTMWYIMKDINEVQVMENNPEDEMNPSRIFTIYEEGYKYEYKEGIPLNDKIYHSIYFYPEESESISKFVLSIDDKETEISSIEIHNKDGGITTYKITNFLTNSSLSEEIFKFKKDEYPEIEIIDLR